jgi:hypothetical protein
MARFEFPRLSLSGRKLSNGKSTLGTSREEILYLDRDLGNSETSPEIISKENPLMVRKLCEVVERDHFDEFERSQEIVRVLGNFVLDVDSYQSPTEGLHEESEQHGPDVDEQFVERDFR